MLRIVQSYQHIRQGQFDTILHVVAYLDGVNGVNDFG